MPLSGNAVTKLEADNQVLEAAFQCQRNRGLTSSRCTEVSCRKMQDLILHSTRCSVNVLRGCSECITYRDLLLCHAKQCRVSRCAPQCHIIKAHIEMKGAPDVGQWTYQLDKLFFRPTHPESPTSTVPIETLEPGPLFSEAQETMPIQEALRKAEIILGKSSTESISDVGSSDALISIKEDPLKLQNPAMCSAYNFGRPPEDAKIVQENLQREGQSKIFSRGPVTAVKPQLLEPAEVSFPADCDNLQVAQGTQGQYLQ